MKEIQKRWLNINETSDYIGLAKGTIYNRTSKKSKNPFPVKCKRMGKRILFDVKELDKFMESL